MLRRPRLRHERRATRPLAAHAESEQRAEDRELPEGLRQSARRGEDGVEQHARDHGARAAEAIGDVAEDQPADRAAQQRDGPERAGLRLREPELRDDRRERQREQHDVERVERPAHRGGDERAPRRCVGDAPPAEQTGVVRGCRQRHAYVSRGRSVAAHSVSGIACGQDRCGYRRYAEEERTYSTLRLAARSGRLGSRRTCELHDRMARMGRIDRKTRRHPRSLAQRTGNAGNSRSSDDSP